MRREIHCIIAATDPGCEIFQRITDLTHQAIGNYGLAIREHPVRANHFLPGRGYGHAASENI
jgi:hypothetical protein